MKKGCWTHEVFARRELLENVNRVVSSNTSRSSDIQISLLATTAMTYIQKPRTEIFGRRNTKTKQTRCLFAEDDLWVTQEWKY